MPLKIQQISHVYTTNGTRAVQALDRVSFDLFPGEICGLYGAPGSGKSTLLHILAGILPLTEGSATDTESSWQPGQPGSRLVGLVAQFPERQLFARTVWEDVAFAPANQGFSGKELAERVERAMRLAGLEYDAFKDRRPLGLSGGERRKVALAGILALSPRYILLDEPTAGLDYSARKILYDTIRKLKAQEIGILLVSHRPQDLLELADRVLILQEGCLRRDSAVLDAMQYIERENGFLQPATPSRDMMYRLQSAGWDITLDIRSPEDLVQAIHIELEQR